MEKVAAVYAATMNEAINAGLQLARPRDGQHEQRRNELCCILIRWDNRNVPLL
jgi:hypothetical protein